MARVPSWRCRRTISAISSSRASTACRSGSSFVRPMARRRRPDAMTEATSNDGVLVQSGRYDGMPSDDARMALTEEASRRSIGEATVQYRLKDWGISRQRYWGTPIPVVYCDEVRHGAGAVRQPSRRAAEAGGVQRARRLAAGAGAGVRQHHVPRVRWTGTPGDRHDGYLRRFVVVLLPVLRSSQPGPAVRSGDGRATGGLSTSTAAASSTRSCI